MEFVLLGIGGLLSLVALVCCILVIVKMFQNQMTGIGIVSIVGIFFCGIGYILTLIYGWQNKVAWGLQKVMPIYTICLVAGIIFYGIGYGMMLPKMMKQIQEQQEQMQQRATDDFGDFEFSTPDYSSDE